MQQGVDAESAARRRRRRGDAAGRRRHRAGAGGCRRAAGDPNSKVGRSAEVAAVGGEACRDLPQQELGMQVRIDRASADKPTW